MEHHTPYWPHSASAESAHKLHTFLTFQTSTIKVHNTCQIKGNLIRVISLALISRHNCVDDDIAALLHQLVNTELRSLMMNSVMMKRHFEESDEECDED